MCGLTGFLTEPGSCSPEQLTTTAGDMADVLVNRGPDDSGVWCDAGTGVAFGHRRLAILDLSEQGHQPMLSPNGKEILIYNGEIYNYRELRRELEEAGRKFRGNSDTEVLLTAISTWGLRETLPRLQGMFAFALWNRSERQLTLVRDRLGIKPLYYGVVGGDFVFASELKAFQKHPRFSNEIDPSAVALLMRHSYIPAPYSIYERIRKLPPGTCLEISPESDNGKFSASRLFQETQPEAYWSVDQIVESGLSGPFTGSFDEAVNRLDELLQDSVRCRMQADVKLGAFLSGGIDSSLICSMMQKQKSRPIRTFTIGFTEHDYDEAPYARRISEYLGSRHTELSITAGDAQAVIPHLGEIYDEPFADMSQIPTCLVSHLARKQVIVALSGDGGDELFCGYPRYFHLENIWNKLRRIPARGLTSSLLGKFARRAPVAMQPERLERIASAARTNSPEELYALLHRHWTPSDLFSSDVYDPSERIGFGRAIPELSSPKLKWMSLDTKTYLPDDILTKVDRASMHNFLEARVPMLDHRIVEFAWSLPPEYRYGKKQGKRILQALLERYLSPALFDRPKVGFGIPIGEWLRGSLRDWAEDLLSEERLREHGLFNHELIRGKWREHVSAERNLQYPLWDILMFQQWYRTWVSSR